MKRFWLTKVYWWFAYTNDVANIVAEVGFPRKRITVFNNAIDTSSIRLEMEQTSKEDLKSLREELGISSDNVGIFIGGMYKEKRVDFLIKAAVLIRQQIPDFELLLVGAGRDETIAIKAAAEHDFIHYTGPKFGREKPPCNDQQGFFTTWRRWPCRARRLCLRPADGDNKCLGPWS